MVTIEPSGARTTLVRDLQNRIIRSTAPTGAITTTLYSPTGVTTVTVDALGGRTTFMHGSTQRGDVTITPLGQRTTTLYDTSNNRIATINPLGQRTTSVYNLSHQQIATINPLGQRTSYGGVALSKKGRNWVPCSCRVSSMSMRVRSEVGVFELQHVLWQFVYSSAAGDVISRFTYLYDPVGNRTQERREDGDLRVFGYDPTNQLISDVATVLKFNWEVVDFPRIADFG